MSYNRDYSSLINYYKLQKSNIFGLRSIINNDLHKIYHHDKNIGSYLFESDSRFHQSIAYYHSGVETSTLNIKYPFPNYYNDTYNITFLSNKNIYNKFDKKSLTLPITPEPNLLKNIEKLYKTVHNIVSAENGLHCKILRKSQSFAKTLNDEIRFNAGSNEILINNGVKNLPNKIFTNELSVSKHNGFTNDLFYCGLLIVPLIGEVHYKDLNPISFNYFGDNVTYYFYGIYFDAKKKIVNVFDSTSNLVGVCSDSICYNIFTCKKLSHYLISEAFKNNYHFYKINNSYCLSKEIIPDQNELSIYWSDLYQKLSTEKINDNEISERINTDLKTIADNFKEEEREVRTNVKTKFKYATLEEDIKKMNLSDFHYIDEKFPEIYYQYERYNEIFKHDATKLNSRYITFISNKHDKNGFSYETNFKYSKVVEEDPMLLSQLKEVAEKYMDTIASMNYKVTVAGAWEKYFSQLQEPSREQIKNFWQGRAKVLHQNIDDKKLDILRKNKHTWSLVDSPETYTSNTCNIFDNGMLPYLKQYVPERLLIEKNNGDEKELFKYRQTTLGFLKHKVKYDACQKYFLTQFAINPSVANLEYFVWSLDLNKTFVDHVLRTSLLIFPIMLMDPSFDKISRYTTFVPDEIDEYVGTIFIPFKTYASRHEIKAFQYFVFKHYYSQEDKKNDVYELALYNYRSNRVFPGVFFEGYRVTYVEINQIHYYNYDFVKKMPYYNCYLYKPSISSSNRIYLFSKLNINQIAEEYKTKYSGLFTDTEIKTIIDELVPIDFKKDASNKDFFSMKKIIDTKYAQTGGYIESFFTSTGYMKIFPSSKHSKLCIMISPTQKYFDSRIFPTDKYVQFNNKKAQVKKLFSSDNEYINTVAIASKYEPVFKIDVGSEIGKPLIPKNYSTKFKPIIPYDGDKILSYDFYDISTPAFLEYFTNSGIVNKKTKNKLLIPKANGYIEAICYYTQKYLHRNNFSDIHVIIPAYIFENYDANIVKGIEHMFDFNKSILLKPLTNETIKNIVNKNITYDFIMIDPHIIDKEIPNHRDQLNHTYLISLLTLSLTVLNTSGNLMITLPLIKTRVTSEIIYYLKGLFKMCKIFRVEHPLSYSYAIFLYDFQGITDKDLNQLYELNEKLYELDPTGFSNYNIINEKEREQFNVTKPLSSKDQKEFIVSFANYSDDIFDEILFSFNESCINSLIWVTHETRDYLNNADDPAYINYITERNLLESINYAKKLNLDIKPGILQNIENDETYIKMTKSMYNYDSIIKFDFAKPLAVKYHFNPHKSKLSDLMNKTVVDYYLASQIIDTRDIDKYNYVKKYIRYYERSLNKKLFDEHNLNVQGRKVSRAWIKFFEILHDIPELLKNMSDVNSFHMCEAPGTFIMSMKYYIENISKNKIRFDWQGQSLRESKIFDDYGLIKKHPKKWDFGEKNTGDITDKDNIRYYIEKYPGRNFITADCGNSWEDRDLSPKLKFSMIVMILGLLTKGGNFVFKAYMPIYEPSIVSLFYIIYCNFDKLIFYKSCQNAWSPEYYVIGINYKFKLPQKQLDYLIDQIDIYNYKICYVEEDSNYKTFVKQLETISSKLKKKFSNAILKNIFFVDNWDNMTDEQKSEMKKVIDNKNTEWIHRFLMN